MGSGGRNAARAAGPRAGGWAIAVLATLAGAGIVADMPASRPAALPPAVPVHTVAVPADPVWQPPERADWMWELGQPLVTTNPRMMGTGVTAYNGDAPPGDNPVVYDIDAIQNPASTVAALHKRGDHVICYIEVGTAGNYYTAAQEGIR